MSGLRVQIDPQDFARVMRELRSFDRTLYTQVRKRLREASKRLVNEVKSEILAGGGSRTGLRQGLADGTRASITVSGRNAGVTITTSGSRLPVDKRPMVRAWNRPSFRHPVYGNRETWVTQTGHPYFESTILQHRVDVQLAILRALQDAIRAMETRA